MNRSSGQKLISLQLNEVNFEYLERYVERGALPTFGRLFEKHGFSLTTSETRYELANPWIQWPTVHTGLDYAEHGVFRTGDIVKTNFEHIYEALESRGLSVAAMSPFNAKNNTKNSPFFVPDPWTDTRFDGPWTMRLLYDALVDVADDYAKGSISLKSVGRLLVSLGAYARPSAYASYLGESLAYFRGKKWYRALVCDRLMMDSFLKEWKKHRPDYSTIFINGAAHLQHHYLFSSQVYDGEKRNPEWVVEAGQDPLLSIFKLYDDYLARFLALGEDVRLMLVTALHQVPHDRETFYYRIDDQAEFLKRIGLEFERTYPLMTEDFVVCFADDAAARRGEELLAAVRTVGGPEIYYRETGDNPNRTLGTAPNIFHIENRGSDLYVQLKPSNAAVSEGMRIESGEHVIENFDRMVSFAQYKNTNHVGAGYFLDTGAAKGAWPAEFPLSDLFKIVLGAFGIEEASIQLKAASA